MTDIEKAGQTLMFDGSPQMPSSTNEPRSALDEAGVGLGDDRQPVADDSQRAATAFGADSSFRTAESEASAAEDNAEGLAQASVGVPTSNPMAAEEPSFTGEPLPPKMVAAGNAAREGDASVLTLPSPCKLPNFTLGRDLSCEWAIPRGIHFEFGQIKYENVVVDREDGLLRFRPLSAGEVKVSLPYNGGKYLTFCMTVNPDPWSLWPNPPPPIDDALVIFDTDRVRLAQNHKTLIAKDYPGLRVIGASRRGRSHERSGTFRDDDLGIWADEANGNYVFIVSDGAGSCKYSREGALQAVNFITSKLDGNRDGLESAWQDSKDDLKPDCSVGLTLAYLASMAKNHLASLVPDVSKKDSKCSLKDFSGTLLLAALKRHADGSVSIVSFAIGDGAIAWYGGNGRFGLLNRPDSGEFGGGTRFLVTPEVWRKIFYPTKDTPWTWNSFCASRVLCKRFSPQEAVGLRVFLMSDGVSDPWFETDAALEDVEKWQRFSEETLMGSGYNEAGLVLSDSPEVNAGRLWDWLYFKIAGNHDDRTLIMAYTVDNAKEEAALNA